MLDELFELSRHLIRLRHRPYLRYFLRETVLKARCSIVAGARGVGKTTAMIQHLVGYDPEWPSSTRVLYLPADHFALAGTPLYEIGRDFCAHGGKLLCIDEIHKYPAWSRDLKSMTDTFPDLRIVASGSSMMQIRKGTHDLSRRAIVYRMNGMSFREYIELRLKTELRVRTLEDLLESHEATAPAIVDHLAERGEKVLALFRDYLECGFYPYAFEVADRGLYRIALEQNAHTAVESDLPAVHPGLSGGSIARIKALLSVIAASVPFTPDLAKLRRLLDINDDRTLKTYLSYLDDADLIMTVGRRTAGLKVLEKPGKIYLGDPNLAYALHPASRPEIGNIRETFFARTVSNVHPLRLAGEVDFAVGQDLFFEVGGRNKTARQLKAITRGFLALDDIETGAGIRIPLWLFGFLY
ncbi:MAG: ATP-binding protein [Kiritimatiellae bacterium]|nr:ATP-binding protein [Kiritimatiellia bacterium]